MPEQSPAAVPGSQTQTPFGASSATGPTPNRGFEAAGLQRLGSVVRELEQMIPLFGASSEPGQAVLKALNTLVKYVPAGSVSPASQKNNAERMMMNAAQNNQQMQALQQQRMQQMQQPAQAA